MSAPPPARLVFLSSLKDIRPLTKVRFLGCVTSYSADTGRLYLQHASPSSDPVIAAVDITLISEGLKKTDTQFGSWLNVVGYVEESPKTTRHDKKTTKVNVQALLMWNAGSLDIGAYEHAAESRIKLDASLA